MAPFLRATSAPKQANHRGGMAIWALSRVSHVLVWFLDLKSTFLGTLGVTSPGPDIPCLGLAGSNGPRLQSQMCFVLLGLCTKNVSTHHSVQFTWRLISFLPLHVYPPGHPTQCFSREGPRWARKSIADHGMRTSHQSGCFESKGQVSVPNHLGCEPLLV